MNIPKPAEVKKALVPVVAGIASLASLGVLHGWALSIATAILAAASAVGVYAAENLPKPKVN